MKAAWQNLLVDFNPRPREEGDIFWVTFLGVVCYFNPRPREEGDFKAYARGEARSYISIHALVKRATKRKIFFGKHHAISIHALVKRATPNAIEVIGRTHYFNPRPREEGDFLRSKCQQRYTIFQSTPS